MGVRALLWKALSKGDAPERDPDELVEAGWVAHIHGPLAVALLERHGIEAVAISQSRDPRGASFFDDVSIRVRRRDADEAGRLIDEGF